MGYDMNGFKGFGLPSAGRAVALASVCALLTGCGGGYLGPLWGSSSAPATPAPAATGQAAGAAAPTGAASLLGGGGPFGRRELNCPYVDVREGAAAHRVYAGQPANSAVRYQFSISDVARECRVVGDQLVIKVGIEGRVLLGPAGAPSSFAVPVSVAVRNEANGQFVANRAYRVAASIPAGSSNTGFSVVSEEISVPFKSLAANEDYQVFVGFDGASSAAGPERRRR